MRTINRPLSLRASIVFFAALGGLAMMSGLRQPAFAAPKEPAAKPKLPTPSTQPIVHLPMRSPQETIASIELPPGYHLELVASEPDVICPVACAWDGNGRMYVAEMRSYMLDINGKNEKDPISRVSRWEDTQGTGKYDKHTIFVDKMLLPRMILPLDDRILIRETDTRDTYAYRDTKGTGVADEKTEWFKGGGQGGNLEHQPSGLVWNIDNWIYTTAEDAVYRYTHGKVETEKVAKAGQWGLAADDTGHVIYNRAGSEQPAYNFQFPIQYGLIRLPEELVAGFTDVFPRVTMTDVQGGPPRLKSSEGGLNHFTGTAGPCVYRGDALPADLYGDYILPEPVGRLIRRARITVDHGKLVMRNAYDGKEFAASSDANFRPVWSATGPDGCLYICDMYHGIIQESNWTKEGSYLRPHIQKYGLEKNIDAGRIYRLTYDGMKPRSDKPHMLDETPAQLVAHLSDRNGWWRDTAQKLIVLKGDKSVVPALEQLAHDHGNAITRLHALWTLDGLDAVTPALLTEKLKDSDANLRAAAVRIAEPYMKKNDAAMMATLKAVVSDPDPRVVSQYCLSLLYAKHSDAEAMVKKIADDRKALAKTEDEKKNDMVQQTVKSRQDAIAQAKADAEKARKLKKDDPKLAAAIKLGKEYYEQTCVACHGPDGMGMPAPEGGITLAPPLKGSKRLLGDKGTLLRIVLHGLVGPNDGKTYPGEMAGFVWAPDDWISPVVTYVRNEWGNSASAIEPADIEKVRKETDERDRPFTLEELLNQKPAEGKAGSNK